MAVKTRTELHDDVDDNITSNNNREITALRVRTILHDIIDSCTNIPDDDPEGTRISLTGASFTEDVNGSHYQNNLLLSLEAEEDFAVFADDGIGTKLKLGDGYSFDANTGEITLLPVGTPPGNYWIVIFGSTD